MAKNAHFQGEFFGQRGFEPTVKKLHYPENSSSTRDGLFIMTKTVDGLLANLNKMRLGSAGLEGSIMHDHLLRYDDSAHYI
jgi:hypothetical protein